MTMVDFNKLHELDKLWKSSKPEMFDEPPGDLYGVNLNPNLTEEEIEDAMFWRKYQRGIILITGSPGSGKDALANMIAFKMKHYFGKTPMLDFKPCKPFGYYEFFDIKFMVREIGIMSEATKVKSEVNKNEAIDEAAKELLTNKQHMFRHSTLVLNEFPRYMEKRHPHRPVTVLLSHLFTIWRHLDILIIGIATSEKYLDQRAFEELTCKVYCSWAITKPMTFWAWMYPVKFIETSGVLVKSGFPDILPVTIDKPQPMLNGLAWKDLFNTEQDISLAIPKSLRREQ